MSDEFEKLYELVLKDSEIHSALWLRIEAYLQAQIQRYRAKNDQNLAPEETAQLRGRIAELKRILAAGESQD